MGLDEFSDLTAELEALRLQGEKLQRESAQTRLDILALVEVPEQGVVTVRYDDDDLVSAVEIDTDARVGLTAQQLVNEINQALLRSGSVLGIGTAAAGASGAQLAATTRLMSELVRLSSDGERPQRQEISNDFGTVTVTALMGSVASVACQTSWIDSTPDRLVSEEIVRMARIAARETDVLGRYT